MIPLLDKEAVAVKTKCEKRIRSKVWDNSKYYQDLIANDRSGSKLKLLVREGIPDELRGLLWLTLLNVYGLPVYERDYESSKKIADIDRTQETIMKAARTSDVGFTPSSRFALNSHGQAVTNNIVSIVKHEFPSVDRCPFLVPAISIMLHHLAPDDVVGAIRILVTKSQVRDKWEYFPTTLRELRLFNDTVEELVKQHLPKIHRHLTGFGAADIFVWRDWLPGFCTDIFCLPMVYRIFDCFLLEGCKILHRIALAVLSIHATQILACTSMADVEQVFRIETPSLGRSVEDENRVFRVAFAFSFSRDTISQITSDKRRRSEISSSSSAPTSPERPHDQPLLPKVLSESLLLTDTHWLHIWSWIPRRYRSYTVKSIFNTGDNGYNLSTMYRLCALAEPQILIVESQEGSIFGAYLSQSWDQQTGTKRFFGTAETFLFSFCNGKSERFPWVGLNVKADEHEKMAEVHKSASLFIYGDYKHLAIGGGGLHFGLSIDESLCKGTSGTCLTFDNPCLVNGTPTSCTFTIKRIEVWAIQ
eukprot:Partr_v1_DN26250_c0_g1_i1_m48628 putative TBC1 domain family member